MTTELQMIDFEVRNSGNEARMREILPCLEQWFAEEMAFLTRERVTGQFSGRLLMVGALWGEKYMARFDRWSLPTLLGKGNLPALAGRATMLLYTDQPSHARLYNRMKTLDNFGIDFEARIIHPSVAALLDAHPINKLWTIGIAHQAGVHIAARHGMDFHMLLPDHIYPIGYMENLLRLGKIHDGIAQNGVSADLDATTPYLDNFRDGTGISIPPLALGDLALQHMHGQTQGALVMPGLPLPASHHILWKGKDKLYHMNCRMNAAWLANAACRAAPTRIPATLDAAIPYFMPSKPYFPVAEDGLTFLELSDGNKYVAPSRLPDWQQYSACAWSTANFELEYLPYFRPLGETPVTPDTGFYWSEGEIHSQHAAVLKHLEDTHYAACHGFAKAMSKGL